MIPPLGQITEDPLSHKAMAEHTSLLRIEAANARAEWERFAEENLELYSYGTLDFDENKLQLNDIQNAVIANVDIQTKEPPAIELKPVETGEPGRAFIQTPMGIIEVPPETAQASVQAAQLLMQPVPQVWLVNDQLRADLRQQVFDVLWERSNVQFFLRNNVLATNIFGWSFPLYEWDDEDMRHRLRNLSVRQVYIDPIAEDISEAAYAGVDQLIDRDEALRLYPDLAEQITAKATASNPEWPEAESSTPQHLDRDYQRPMVVLSTMWMRYSSRPKTPDEVIYEGEATLTEVPTGNQSPVLDPTGSALVGFQPETRQAFVSPSGQELIPGSENWPSKRVVRQVTEIAGEIVEDKECEHWDIPLLHNVNIPIPGRPFGIGEPFRLRKLQEYRTRTLEAIVQTAEYNKAPIKAMPRRVADAIKEVCGRLNVAFDKLIIMPDDIWSAYSGELLKTIPAAPIAESLVETQALLRQEISEQGGNTNERRGIATSKQMSGRAIEVLQGAALGNVSFKASRLQTMVHRLACLMNHIISTRLTAQQIQRICSKFPIEVMRSTCSSRASSRLSRRLRLSKKRSLNSSRSQTV